MALPKLVAGAAAVPVGLGKMGMRTAASMIRGAVQPFTPRGIIEGIKGNLGIDTGPAMIGIEAIKDAYARLARKEDSSKEDRLKESAERKDTQEVLAGNSAEVKKGAKEVKKNTAAVVDHKSILEKISKTLTGMSKSLEKINKSLAPDKKIKMMGEGGGLGGLLGNIFGADGLLGSLLGGVKNLFGGGGGLMGMLAGYLGLKTVGKLAGGAVRGAGRLAGAGLGAIGKGVGALGRKAGAGIMTGLGAIGAAGPVKSLIEKFTGKAAGEVGEKAAQKAGTEVAEKAATKATGEVGEKVAQKATGELGEKAVKAAGLEAGEKAAKGGIGSRIAAAIGKRLPKALGGAAVKQIPLLGLAIAAGFAISKLVEGDTTGAALAAAEGLPVAGIPAAVAGVARDVYNDVYGTPDNKYPFDTDMTQNPELFKQRHGEIYTEVKKAADDFLSGGAKPAEQVKPPESSQPALANPTPPEAAPPPPAAEGQKTPLSELMQRDVPVWTPSSPIIPGQERRGAGGVDLDGLATVVPGATLATPSQASSGRPMIQASPTADGITPQTRAVDQLSLSAAQAPVVVNNFMNNAPTINNQSAGGGGGDLNVAAAASGYRTPADIGSYAKAAFTTI